MRGGFYYFLSGNFSFLLMREDTHKSCSIVTKNHFVFVYFAYVFFPKNVYNINQKISHLLIFFIKKISRRATRSK